MVTIVLLCSRNFLLDKILDLLDNLECDKSMTNLLIIVDGDGRLYLEVRNKANKLTFNDKLVVKAPPKRLKGNSMQIRRNRIAELHNFAKTCLKPSKWVLCLEDDGLFPIDGLQKLLDDTEKLPDVGIVQGIQVGRWQSRYIGAWLTDNVFDMTLIKSIEYTPNRIVEIDSGGLYFSLTRFDLYTEHHWRTDPNYGPDLVYGFQCKRKGFKNYADCSIILDHINEASGRVFKPTDKDVRVVAMQRRNSVWRFINKVAK